MINLFVKTQINLIPMNNNPERKDWKGYLHHSFSGDGFGGKQLVINVAFPCCLHILSISMIQFSLTSSLLSGLRTQQKS